MVTLPEREGGPDVLDKVDLEVELPWAKGAPQLARWVMRSWCSGRIDADLLSDAELMVSELATHALLHGQGKITLRVRLDEDRLFAQVLDEGPGFERRLRRGDSAQTGRWQLKIVEDISKRWGVHEGPSHTSFELARVGARLDASGRT